MTEDRRFVPGGGTSVLRRALGMPRAPVEAAEAIARALEAGRTRPITVGRVNGRRFTFSAGLGLDAELIRRVGDVRQPGAAARGATGRASSSDSTLSRRA